MDDVNVRHRAKYVLRHMRITPPLDTNLGTGDGNVKINVNRDFIPLGIWVVSAAWSPMTNLVNVGVPMIWNLSDKPFQAPFTPVNMFTHLFPQSQIFMNGIGVDFTELEVGSGEYLLTKGDDSLWVQRKHLFVYLEKIV